MVPKVFCGAKMRDSLVYDGFTLVVLKVERLMSLITISS